MNNNSQLQFLPKFAVNLNEQASQGKLDPVIGRDDEELERIKRNKGDCALKS